MKRIILLIVCPVIFTGCNTGTMIRDSYDARTNQRTHTVYTKYYDAGAWIIPHHLGMSVVVDHEKKRIPVIYNMQLCLGALGPDDLEANGKITVYIWNCDKEEHRVKILRVSSGDKSIEPKDKEITVARDERAGEEIGSIPIFNYGTNISLQVEYMADGKLGAMELNLPRRTPEDIQKYFGPNGTPPYPWYHEKETNG